MHAAAGGRCLERARRAATIRDFGISKRGVVTGGTLQAVRRREGMGERGDGAG